MYDNCTHFKRAFSWHIPKLQYDLGKNIYQLLRCLFKKIIRGSNSFAFNKQTFRACAAIMNITISFENQFSFRKYIYSLLYGYQWTQGSCSEFW